MTDTVARTGQKVWLVMCAVDIIDGVFSTEQGAQARAAAIASNWGGYVEIEEMVLDQPTETQYVSDGESLTDVIAQAVAAVRPECMACRAAVATETVTFNHERFNGEWVYCESCAAPLLASGIAAPA